jgi:hypothetical protein
MSDSKAFTSMEGLLENLSKAMSRMKEGKLEIEELEEVTNEARDLYERWVVLRFQAYERLLPQEQEQQEDEFSFRIDSKEVLLEKQTSLIDAIEEASKDDSIDEEPVLVEDNNSTNDKVVEDRAPQTKFEVESIDLAEDKSLASKLQHTPIADLKKAISLNQKFQFISAFFGGNSQQYEALIEQLNTSINLDDAQGLIEKSIGILDEEEPIAAMFLELVERRHS